MNVEVFIDVSLLDSHGAVRIHIGDLIWALFVSFKLAVVTVL